MTKYYSPSTTGFYDTDVWNEADIPCDCIKITDSLHRKLLTAINEKGHRVVVDGEKITTVKRDPEVSWDIIRNRRNRLLAGCDYTQMPDFPGDRTAWAAYRQDLRDITEKYSTPSEVKWPKQPRK